MLREAVLAYRVAATTHFAQISLFFVVKSAFYSFFAPTFKFFSMLSFCTAHRILEMSSNFI